MLQFVQDLQDELGSQLEFSQNGGTGRQPNSKFCANRVFTEYWQDSQAWTSNLPLPSTTSYYYGSTSTPDVISSCNQTAMAQRLVRSGAVPYGNVYITCQPQPTALSSCWETRNVGSTGQMNARYVDNNYVAPQSCGDVSADIWYTGQYATLVHMLR